ncbi:hypothetical protein TVAG_034670 [Trichomonas vaginalis G3]|uniref:Uncharacterized protein n=1 Tax=Trichomonas vaginalis (strain ATCC PRA-98 / G3) TaxID=412133 RepID=A2FJ77_TRIV3|nr:hypothetical protein TVAGG3_0440760 [Trichomonas vaginalis G3]EAX95038.1 hypothetical protein TVAG_034670 [Trichomonas vaginalis G3]KAI5537440.1 hypothetical protein TVAGG3_0440760 [Trichomonas vaginalis G3]|eukprot:XP_001307968.1 hypothetical protein [Trichomonas vaginalis G3]
MSHSPIQEKYNRFNSISNISLQQLNKSLNSSILKNDKNHNSVYNLTNSSFICDDDDCDSFTSPSFTKHVENKNDEKQEIINDFGLQNNSTMFSSHASNPEIQDEIDFYLEKLDQFDQREAAARGILTTPVDDISKIEEYVSRYEEMVLKYEEMLEVDKNADFEQRLLKLQNNVDFINIDNKKRRSKLLSELFKHILESDSEILQTYIDDIKECLDLLDSIEILQNLVDFEKRLCNCFQKE